MEASTSARTSLLGLVKELTGETKTFIRQELQLLKTELSEKMGRLGRDAAMLAMGGFTAYAGFIVFLIGLGWLLTYAFENAGLDPVLASFAGAAAIGLVVLAVGAAFALKAFKAISRHSLVPQRILHTLQELKTAPAPLNAESTDAPTPRLSTPQIQAQIEATEERIEDTIEEVGRRLSPRYVEQRVRRRIQEKPYSAGLIAILAGFLSGLFLRRGSRHS